jgi:hypothetical protein
MFEYVNFEQREKLAKRVSSHPPRILDFEGEGVLCTFQY